jgi:cytidylate kinase
MARDSVKLDTSELDIDEVVTAIRQVVGKKILL